MSRPENPPAFPRTLDSDEVEFMSAQPGMSLRDWFAGQALIALPDIGCGADLDVPDLALAAYQVADAMLVARAKATGSAS